MQKSEAIALCQIFNCAYIFRIVHVCMCIPGQERTESAEKGKCLLLMGNISIPQNKQLDKVLSYYYMFFEIT